FEVMKNNMPIQTSTRLALVALAATLSACSGPKDDQLRTVKSFDFATCNSTPTTDATERAALDAFKAEIEVSNFLRAPNTLTVAKHEDTLEMSGLRQYSGPFCWCLHPGQVQQKDAERGVTWSGMAYLHADKVPFRANGGDWGKWERVRTRNF